MTTPHTPWPGTPDPTSPHPDPTDNDTTSSLVLFDGDDGGLELAERRTLVVLLKRRFISARTHPREWRTLTANPRPIRSRLNDLFLDLHIDPDREVAYKRQVQPEGGGSPFPTLLHDTPWGREDTVLLVYLRARLRAEQAAGADRAFADVQDMLDHLASHRPPHATDQRGDENRTRKAIENLHRAGLLIGPSTAERFEISTAIEVLLPLPKLTELLTWLRTHNNSTDPAPEPSTTPQTPAEAHP